MSAVCAITLLCLMSLSHSAPLDCKDVQPLDQADPRHYEGTWAMVASNLKIVKPEHPVIPTDSIRIDFYNSTSTQSNRYGFWCTSFSSNISIEGPNLQIGQMSTYNGTLFNTSCSDCMILKLVMDTPKHKTVEVCLFSKRREVDQNELKEFRAQVECLNMPTPFVMDPTKELCPKQILPQQL